MRILRRLGFDLAPEPGRRAEFTVHIPSWRLDMEREIDLIEEIARLHGYDKFTSTLPAYAGAVVELPQAKKDEKLRSSLLALGYNEAISLTFISYDEAEQFAHTPVIELENPLSEEASVMRTSLVPGMLNMLAYNLNRGSNQVRLFESGNVFERVGKRGVATQAGLPGSNLPTLRKTAEGGAPTAEYFSDLRVIWRSLLRPFQHKTLVYDAHGGVLSSRALGARSHGRRAGGAVWPGRIRRSPPPTSCVRMYSWPSFISISFTSMDCARRVIRHCRAIRQWSEISRLFLTMR